jgi:hypothetical protein
MTLANSLYVSLPYDQGAGHAPKELVIYKVGNIGQFLAVRRGVPCWEWLAPGDCSHVQLHLALSPVPTGAQRLPSCCICNDPVLLETSNTDEYGQAVHEECYVLKVCSKAEVLNDDGSMPVPANRHAIDQPDEGMIAEGWESPMPSQPAMLTTMRRQRAKLIPRFNRPWKVDMALVVTVLVIACWIAYSDRDPASFLRSSGMQRSTTIEEQVLLPSHRPRQRAVSCSSPCQVH